MTLDQQTQTTPRTWYFEATEFIPPYEANSILRAVLNDPGSLTLDIQWSIWLINHWHDLPYYAIVLDGGLREITKLEFVLLTGHAP